MSLNEQVIPIDFSAGIDTKTDPKAVVAGKFLRLENAVFTNPKRIAKRNGYMALGSSTAPTMAHAYQNELIKADSGNLLSWSPTQSAWFSRGKYTSTELTRYTVDQDRPASGYTDCAVLGNYALYGWSTAAQQNSTAPLVVTYSKVLGSVVDLQTGATLVGPQVLSTSSSSNICLVRTILLSTTVLAIFYPNAANTAIMCRLVTIGSGTVSFGSELTVTSNFSAGFFDVVSTSTGAVIFYKSTTGVKVATLDTAGAVTNSLNIIDADASSLIGHASINSSNGNIWLYWVADQGLGINGLVYAVYSSSLVVVLAKTNIISAPSPSYITNIIAVSDSATQQTAYYSEYEGTAGSARDTTKSVAVTTSAAGAPAVFVYNAVPFSRPFTVSGANYAVFVHRGGKLNPGGGAMTPQIQPTYFVVLLSTATTIPLVVARFGAGVANTQTILETVIGYMPGVASISTTKFLFACAIETQEFLTDYFATPEFFPGGLAGAFSYSIDFNSANGYRATNAGQLAVLNGGLLQAYDSQSVSELGFHVAPEIYALAKTNTAAGAIANGTYSYIAIFQWTDAQGNLHQSTPSAPASITLGGAEDTITISVTTYPLSQKTGVSVAIYRTVTLGSVYYLVTDPIFLTDASASGAGVTSYVDVLADASLAGNPQAYTYPASSVLENSTPPPSMAMTAHNNRLWFLNDENKNEIWYTKTFSQGTGLSPSAFLLNEVDPKLGDISALAEMDDKLVGWKASVPFVQSGDGANDVGSGSTLSAPQFIPSDVGCSIQKSIVLTPKGLIFKSANGIYLLDRSLNVSYIGAEVESYNSQTITAATLVPGKSQIRFLCSSGLTLVYDYIFNQWSTFTAHTGVSATAWNSTYVYSTGSAVLQESAGTYTDNGSAFALLAQTSWLALAGIQGFQRVRRLIMLGDFVNGLSANHKLSISAAYDFSTTFQTAISYSFGAASASGVFQYRERLPIQKCDSISLLIQETTTGSALEYIDLTNISFEAGVKKGVNKLGGAYSVG